MKRARMLLLFIFVPFVCLALTVLTADAAKKKKIPKTPKFVGAAKCDGSCHDPWYQAWMNSGHGKTYNLLKPGERTDAKKKAEALIKEKLVKFGGRDQAYVDGLDVTKADFTSEPLCLRCHTTGFGQSGGFRFKDTKTKKGKIKKKTAIDPEEPSLEQVGCEMCHSVRGGSQFRMLMKNTEGDFTSAQAEKLNKRYDNNTGNVCKRCHEHQNTPFQPSLDDKYKFNFEERKKKVHNIEKYRNADNKDQVIEKRKDRLTKDPGVTYTKNLVIEQWVIKNAESGKIGWKAKPMTGTRKKGYTFHFQDGSKLNLNDIKADIN